MSLLFLKNCRSYKGVCTSVVKVPFALVQNETLHKDSPVRVLTAFFELLLRHEERLIKPADDFTRVIQVKKELSCTVGIGRVPPVPVLA